MSLEQTNPFPGADGPSEKIEREFVLKPLLRKVSARVLGRRGATQMDPFAMSADQLPPDTLILYPDQYGNYVTPVEFPESDEVVVAHAIEIEKTEAYSPELKAQGAAERQELPLAVSNLSYFAQHAEAEARREMSAMGTAKGRRQIAPPAQARASERVENVRPLGPSLAMLLLEMMSSPKWKAAKPALGYGAVGFAMFLLLFLLPGERRPASVLLPAAEASAAPFSPAGAEAAEKQPAITRNLEPPHGGVTIAIPSSRAAEPSSSERATARSQKEARDEIAEDVVIRHFEQKAQPRVERTSADVKRYSDLP